MGGCTEDMIYFVEGANFGANCPNAMSAVEDPTRWTLIKYEYDPRDED